MTKAMLFNELLGPGDGERERIMLSKSIFQARVKFFANKRRGPSPRKRDRVQQWFIAVMIDRLWTAINNEAADNPEVAILVVRAT